MSLATTIVKMGTVACLVAVMLSATSVRGEMIVTTADGNGADTFLQNDAQDAGTGPDVVRGNVDTMLFRYNLTSRVKIPYFRFDLSGIRGDRDGAILTLQLTTNNGNRSRALDVYGLVNDNTNDAWPEGGTSYSNAPGFIYTDPDLVTAGNQPSSNYTIDPTELVLLGTITTPAGIGVVNSNIASLNLDAFLAADTNKLVTLVLLRSVSDSNVEYRFATKENVTAGITFPTLRLPNALPIPEPSSLAGLIVLGMTAALSRRRR